jgi:hypothetical protein
MSREERVEIVGADGHPLGWTYDARQYDLVGEQVLLACDALADESGVVLLKDVVAFVQARLGDHPAFPSGRLTNATRYVAADLRGRGVLERVGTASPQRLRHPARGTPPGEGRELRPR